MNKEQWIKRALQKGIEAFEIYQGVQTEKSITWFDGHMDTMTTSHVLGTSIRGIYDGNMANIAMEEVNDDQMDDVLDELIDQAKVITTKDKDVLRKPESFDEMVRIVTLLSKGLKQVRVDLYNVGGRVYFGEMTITNGGGFEKFDPESVDKMLGDLWTIK